MGSNMQRQAVPLLRAEAPVVGTGLERRAALDSGTVVRAKHDGKVTFVDARNITVQRGNMVDGNFVPLTGLGEDYEFLGKDPIDNYVLRKFERSNQDSCINQKPIVDVGDFVKAGDVLADGVSTDHGELALGKNILIGFLPWNGYNPKNSPSRTPSLPSTSKNTNSMSAKPSAVRKNSLAKSRTSAKMLSATSTKTA